jgi:hypothetical protein
MTGKILPQRHKENIKGAKIPDFRWRPCSSLRLCDKKKLHQTVEFSWL